MFVFRKHNLLLSLTLLVGLLFSCAPEEDTSAYEEAGKQGTAIGQSDATSGTNSEGCIEIDRPKSVRVAKGMVELRPANGKFRGDLLVLPAWGQPRDAWCQRSSFCQLATDRGFRVIMPEMGKSIYIDRAYPETREDWKNTPSYSWLRDSLIPGLQEEYCMLDPKGANFVIGLSSGARGVVKLLSDHKDLFMAGAALSGDYDPGQLIGDNIYKGFLGEYDEHADRWLEKENLITLANNIETPLYLGHGTEDPMIPFTQTRSLYDALQQNQPSLQVKLNLAAGLGESFAYWNTEIDQILGFFEDAQANRPETP